jgi:hypothetical protein
VGATQFGKTSLIATARRCAQDRATGYDGTYDFRVSSTGNDEWMPEAHGAETYNYLEDRFFSKGGPVGTTVENTFMYKLNFTMTRRGPASTAIERVVPVTIADTGGGALAGRMEDFLNRDGDFVQESDVRQNYIRYFREILPRATGLVLVIPLFDYARLAGRVVWDARVNMLLQQIADKFKNIKRIAVVMTHYDRMFVDFGADAVLMAADPDVVKRVLRAAVESLQHRNLLPSLFDDSLADRRMMFMAASSHGFVRTNGCPNFNPDDNTLLFKAAAEPAPENTWRPFCTADPFLFSAFDEKSKLMFTLEELGFQRPSRRRPKRGLWRVLWPFN